MQRESDATATLTAHESRQGRNEERPTDPWSGSARNYITPPTLARLLGVSTRTVTRWCRQGRIDGADQFVGVYSTWRIPIEALERFGLTDLSDLSESGGAPAQDGE